MKFGDDFHRHIVPEWSLNYVDYNLLKGLVKSSYFSDVYEHLNATISALDWFFWRKFDALSGAQTELWDFFASRVQPVVIPGVNELDSAQLKFLLGAFSELEQDLEKLHWFEWVNTEAVSRILSKLERHGQADSSPYHDLQTRWQKSHREWGSRLLDFLDGIGRLINDDVKELLASPGSPTNRYQFLAHALNQESNLQIPDDAVQAAVQNGKLDLIIHHLKSVNAESSVMKPGYSDLIRSLLRFCLVSLPVQYEALLTLIPPAQRTLMQWNLVKWYIITIGQVQKIEPGSEMARSHPDSTGGYPLPAFVEADVFCVPEALLKKDLSGRILLHHAARHGLLPICQRILTALGESAGVAARVRATLSVDEDRLTPLHLAVTEDNTSTAVFLVDTIFSHSTSSDTEALVKTTIGDALLIALRRGNDGIVQHLLRGYADLTYQSRHRETALHVASQLGRADYVDLIVRAMPGGRAGLDVRDSSRGWTPLFFACANGDYDLAELLLKAGSGQEITDYLGWTAKEHAVLKGHLAVAGLFKAPHTRVLTGGPAHIRERKSPHDSIRPGEGEKIIIANLGTTRKDRVVTGLSHTSCSSTPGGYESVWFALEISAPGSTSKPRRIRLPVLDDQINDPFVFSIPQSSEPRLLFRVIRASRGCSGGAVFGSGTALLEANTHQFGAQRQSLIRDQTVPILDKDTMEVTGTVTFTSLVVKPYPYLQTPQPVRTTRDALGRPILVGHRGAGMNTSAHDYLQLGENTVESFLSAAKLGASFVEFDVQVTRDLKAVAFHDFSLSETGTDVPVHDLTLEQFLHASNLQSPHGNPVSVLGTAYSRNEPARSRSRSVGRQFEAGAIQVRDRMKHTVDFGSKGFKPNTRGDFIQDSFATIKEILAELPPDIGCDMEIKYPRLHEAVDAGVAPVAIELNTFVDVALNTIHRYGGNRPIILSSFTPEICILLSMKQKAYPVFFITNAGRVPMIDMEVRAANVQVAVKFAERWNLAGIVFACEALLLCPRLVGFVKGKGLVCATYGVLNNEPEKVKEQVEAGVDIIVADRVGLVAKTLAAT